MVGYRGAVVPFVIDVNVLIDSLIVLLPDLENWCRPLATLHCGAGSVRSFDNAT